MGQLKYDIRGDRTITSSAENLRLSILLGVDSFSYILCDQKLVLQGYRHYEQPLSAANLLETLTSDKMLNGRSFRKVRVLLSSPAISVVPERLFKEEETRNYLTHLTDIPADALVRADKIPAANARIVYSLTPAVEEVLQKQLSGYRLHHYGTALINSLPILRSGTQEEQLFLTVWEGRMLLVLSKGRALQFINTYSFRSAQDFIYYVMLAFDQFQLDQKHTPVNVMGHINQDGELYRMLDRYIGTIQLAELPTGYQYGKSFEEHLPHFYLDVLLGLLA